MPRPKHKPLKRLSPLECFQTITESFDQVIPTKFAIIDFGEYTAFRFNTTSGNVYDLEFHQTIENSNIILNGKYKLGDIIKTTDTNINTIDIGFTLSSTTNKDNPEEYELEMNLNEQFELMGRITFILKKQLNQDKKTKLFIVGASKRNKPKIYEKIFNNHFSYIFNLYYGVSDNHDGVNSLFITKKT